MSYYDEVMKIHPLSAQVRAKSAEIAARADARIAELERECSQWRDELRIYREAENSRIAELEQSVTVRDTEVARLETDLELARMDGERYRWLTSAPISWEESAGVNGYILRIDGAKLRGATINDAIDKARAGNGGGV